MYACRYVYVSSRDICFFLGADSKTGEYLTSDLAISRPWRGLRNDFLPQQQKQQQKQQLQQRPQANGQGTARDKWPTMLSSWRRSLQSQVNTRPKKKLGNWT